MSTGVSPWPGSQDSRVGALWAAACRNMTPFPRRDLLIFKGPRGLVTAGRPPPDNQQSLQEGVEVPPPAHGAARLVGGDDFLSFPRRPSSPSSLEDPLLPPTSTDGAGHLPSRTVRGEGGREQKTQRRGRLSASRRRALLPSCRRGVSANGSDAGGTEPVAGVPGGSPRGQARQQGEEASECMGLGSLTDSPGT